MLTLKQLILLALSNLKCKEEPLTFAIHLPLFCLFGCIICAQDKQTHTSIMRIHFSQMHLKCKTTIFLSCHLLTISSSVPYQTHPSLPYILMIIFFLDVTHKFENCSFILSLLEQEGNIHCWVCECNTLF